MRRKRFAGALCAAAFALGNLTALPAAITIRAEEEDEHIVFQETAYSQDDEPILWTLTDDGTVVISGKGKMLEHYLSPLESYYQAHDASSDAVKVKKVIIEEGITHLLSNVFYSGADYAEKELSGAYYDELTAVSLPESLRSIGAGAFYGCSSLQELNIPAGVAEIGTDAFAETPWYAEYCKQFTDGFVILNDVLLECPDAENVVIPDGVKRIVPKAVRSGKIKRLRIPDSITQIAPYALKDCESLAEIEFPETLTEIGYCAFENTAWLKQQQAENPFVVVNGILTDGTACKGNLTIPDTVKQIGTGAFAGNDAITGAVIPDSVTEMKEAAFLHCKSLKSITFPDSISRIPEYTCGYCTSLTDIHYSDSIRIIGAAAFDRCAALTDFTIPATVTTVELGAFYECDQMKKVTFLNPYCRFYWLAFTFGNSEMPFDYSVQNIGTFCGYDGSIAEEYANATIHQFQSLGAIPEQDFFKPLLCGDVTLDSELDIADAVLLARFLVEDASVSLTADARLCANTNQEDGITMDDVTAILRRIAKLEHPTINEQCVADRDFCDAQEDKLDELYFFFEERFDMRL